MELKKNILRTLLLPIFISGTAVTAIPAFADDKAEIERLKSLIEELDQRVKILGRKQEISAEESAAKQKTAPALSAGESGFGFKSADGQFEYKLRGLVHFDYRSFDGEAFPTAIDGFTARRIRPTFEGTLFGKYGFRFTPEFGENKSAVVDAYLDARFDPAAQLRFGKFKPSVGLERLQSASDIKFIERSYVSNNILPNRDLGISLSGDLLNKKLNYAVGIFNGVADGAENTTTQDINSAKEYAARIFTTPFSESDNALRGLGFGIAGTFGTSKGIASATNVTSNLATYKTPGQANSFFNFRSKAASATSADDNVIANGNRIRFSPQAYYYNGPLGIIAEYASVEQDVKIGSTAAGAKTFKNEAWQLAGSWLLTGEDASFKGVKPYSPFDANGGWGAWELVARYQENNIDKDAVNTLFIDTTKANAGSAKTWGAGVNWYLNQSSKFAFNLEQTRFSGGTGTGSMTGKKETFAVARYQLAF